MPPIPGLYFAPAPRMAQTEDQERTEPKMSGGRAPDWVLQISATLLPVHARAGYLEEWRGELYDLRADSAPWWRLAAYVLDILRGAPR